MDDFFWSPLPSGLSPAAIVFAIAALTAVLYVITLKNESSASGLLCWAQTKLGAASRPQLSFVPFKEIKQAKDISCLVVDCTHPFLPQLTHHKSQKVPTEVRGDSSSDTVLNAIKMNHPILRQQMVSTNHFDIDSFVSVWSAANPEPALKYELLLREIAKIGDFRELRLDERGQHHDIQHQALSW
jgi:hypothetical protein